MGKIKKPHPVKFFVAMISRDELSFNLAMDKLQEKYGNFDLISGIIPFNFTDYYRKEMGDNLLRQFTSFEKLMDPATLPDMKLFTNNLEESLGDVIDEKLHRRVNLDAGYIALDKMVLASTKNYRHRIYLRDGIYAEVTLYWSKGSFHFFPEHTYPDYRTEFYMDYFRGVREKYVVQLKG